MRELTTFLTMRTKMREFVSQLPADALQRIPAGFTNHIGWNLGHVLVTHQVLCYKLSGLPMHVDDTTFEQFVNGSSPGAWTEKPDLDPVLEQLVPLAERFAQDYEAGIFEEFRPYTTSTGLVLDSVEQAFSYNLMHEGLHFGYAMAQRRALG